MDNSEQILHSNKVIHIGYKDNGIWMAVEINEDNTQNILSEDTDLIALINRVDNLEGYGILLSDPAEILYNIHNGTMITVKE